MTNSTTGRFGILRAQIELNTPAPAVILVTSATAMDGSTIVAIGLADCLAAAGHRVALITNHLETSATDADRPGFSVHAFGETVGEGQNLDESVATLIQGSLRDFDFTIVDGPPLLQNRTSMLFAASAEAVVLSIRLGRSRCAEDDLMMHALERTEARVLGVVGASEASIQELASSTSPGLVLGDRVSRSKPSLKSPNSIAVVP